MLKCEYCGDLKQAPIMRRKGPHLGIYCPKCKRWVKWANKAEAKQYLETDNRGEPIHPLPPSNGPIPLNEECPSEECPF